MNKRVLVYVDGFNVYYGFKRKKWNYFLWLDYRQVFESIPKQNQELIDVKCFTALSLKGLAFGRYDLALPLRNITHDLLQRHAEGALLVAGQDLTCDLRVMSPTRYAYTHLWQAALASSEAGSSQRSPTFTLAHF